MKVDVRLLRKIWRLECLTAVMAFCPWRKVALAHFKTKGLLQLTSQLPSSNASVDADFFRLWLPENLSGACLSHDFITSSMLAVLACGNCPAAAIIAFDVFRLEKFSLLFLPTQENFAAYYVFQHALSSDMCISPPKLHKFVHLNQRPAKETSDLCSSPLCSFLHRLLAIVAGVGKSAQKIKTKKYVKGLW